MKELHKSPGVFKHKDVISFVDLLDIGVRVKHMNIITTAELERNMITLLVEGLHSFFSSTKYAHIHFLDRAPAEGQ